MAQERSFRFSATQLTVMVVAVCLAVVAAPVGVMAATGSLVNVTDPYTSSYKARVNAKGGLVTSIRDGATGANAKVDSSGRQLVSGPVTVTNPVSKVTTVPGAPVTPVALSIGSTPYTVPAGKRLVIEDISVGVTVSPGATAAAQIDMTTGGTHVYYTQPITVAESSASYTYYSAARQTRLYADAGTTVGLYAGSSGTVLVKSLTLSGYLV